MTDSTELRFEGLHGENSTIIRFAVAPRNFSFLSKCGSEKKTEGLDVSPEDEQSTLLSSSGSSQNHTYSQKISYMVSQKA